MNKTFMVLAISVTSACHTEVPSMRTTTAVAIDGQPGDWEHVPQYLLPDHDVSLSLQNDDTGLYLHLTTADPGAIQRARIVGVTLWLDESGGERRDSGLQITLRGEQPATEEPSIGAPQFFSVGEGRSLEGAQVVESQFRGTLALEVRLPFSAALAPGPHEVGLGLEIPETVVHRSGGGRGLTPMTPGGMGMNRHADRGAPRGPAAGPPVGGGGGPSEHKSESLEKELVWLRVKIPSR